MDRSAPDGLQEALAATFALYRDTHVAHWNVTGPSFPQLHVLLDQQYNELWAALDTVAERIRACGDLVDPGCMDGGGSIDGSDPQEFLPALARSHRDLASQWAALARACAESDLATADLATERVGAHEKHAWMLEATQGGASSGQGPSGLTQVRPAKGLRARLRRLP